MAYREVRRLLLQRQSGSHALYAHPDGRKTAVPRHGYDLPPFLVAKILKDAGLDPGEVRR